MTASLLLGFSPIKVSVPPSCPPHDRICDAAWTLLALDVDPRDAEQAEGIVGWAKMQNAILARYAAKDDVLPLPLGIVCSDDAAARAFVETHRERLMAASAELAGHCEYALHVRRDSAAADTLSPSSGSAGGRAYLAQRRTARDGRRNMSRALSGFLTRLHAALDSASSQVRDMSRGERGRLLDLVALVPRGAHEGLVDKLKSLEEEAGSLGLACSLIGPGPAYSFASTDFAHG